MVFRHVLPVPQYPTGGGPPPSAGGIGALQMGAFRPATAPQQPDGGDAAAAPHAGTSGGGADAGEEAQVWPSAAKLMSRGNSPGHVGLTGNMGGAGAGLLASSLMGGAGSPRAMTPVSLPSRLAGMTALSMGGLSMGGLAGVPPIGGGSMGGPAQQQKVAQLGHEVAAVKGETDALRESVERLNQQVASLRAGLSSSASESLSRVQALEENVHTLQVGGLAGYEGGSDLRMGLPLGECSLDREEPTAGGPHASVRGAAAAGMPTQFTRACMTNRRGPSVQQVAQAARLTPITLHRRAKCLSWWRRAATTPPAPRRPAATCPSRTSACCARSWRRWRRRPSSAAPP